MGSGVLALVFGVNWGFLIKMGLGESPSLGGFTALWRWHLGTLVSGGLSSAGEQLDSIIFRSFPK